MLVESVSKGPWNECPSQRGIAVQVFVDWVSKCAWNPQSSRLWRRLIVLGSIALVTTSAVSQTDKLTPVMATPIAEAIAQFKTETAKYPAALADLSPKYLAELPAVRAAVIQPSITYTVRDGRPRLAIPSARGDAFANYEYDFEAKAWVHNY